MSRNSNPKQQARRRLLEETWNDFSRKVIAPTAGPIQRQEMRKAFFFGAHSLLEAMNKCVGTPQEVTVVGDLAAEMEAFANEILKAGGKHA